MPQKKLILDGLWYCLCPSFSLATPRRPGVSLVKGRRDLHSGRLPSSLPRRCYSSSKSAGADNDSTQEGAAQASASNTKSSAALRNSPHVRSIPTRRIAHPPKQFPEVPENLAGQSTADLESKLKELSTRAPTIHGTLQILQTLVRDRHVRPGVRHYRALILANADPERGSPEVLRGLLSEMENNGIPVDSGTLHAALQVLAVHPDYLLRQEILRTLRDRWLPLSPTGWHYVVAGLLRESQFELALDHIAHMERKDIVIQDWLHALVIYHLCEFEEFDEVTRVMRSRVNQGHDMSSELWEYVLDVASAVQHEELTRFAWAQMVQLGYMTPSREICNRVLAMASRAGDADLAASVVQVLAESEIQLEQRDYEKLVETHITAGSLFSALEVLCSMHKAGLAVKESITHPVLMYMIQMKIRPRDAWGLLKRLKTMKHTIPPECARIVFELCEHEAQDDPFAVDDGIELYKELYTLCPGGADVNIYNTLVNMCRQAQNREATMFVVKEMASFGVVPNATTFERLIFMCLDAGNYESAYLYFQDMLERGFAPDEEAKAEIRDQCTGSSDKFAVQLKYHPKIRGDLVRTKEPGDTLVPKDRIKKPSSPAVRHALPPKEDWMIPNLSKEERRAISKARRKAKRRRMAIARGKEEEGWMEYEAGGLEPEVKV